MRVQGLASPEKTWGWTWKIRHRQDHLEGTNLWPATRWPGKGQPDQDATREELGKRKAQELKRINTETSQTKMRINLISCLHKHPDKARDVIAG